MSIEPYAYLGLKFNESTEYKNKIRERDKKTCRLCGRPGHDVDHIIPWHISHDSSESNLRVLCHGCNVSLRRKRKDARPSLDEWYAQLEAELVAGKV